MGGSSSKFSCTGGFSSCTGSPKGVKHGTKRKISKFLNSDPGMTDLNKLHSLLTLVPMEDSLFMIYFSDGFNLIQKCVAENNVEALRVILSMNPDLNSGPCSYPLHIACLLGYTTCALELIKHGASLDVEAPMCWPGPHSQHCEGIMYESRSHRRLTSKAERAKKQNPGRDVYQNSLYYAVDGDQASVLKYLMQIRDGSSEDTLEDLREKRPMLEVACERKAWACCNFLIETRSEEIRLCYLRHLENPNSSSLEMTLLHVLFLMARKPADFTLRACGLLLDNGLRSVINATDSLGNTPLHGLIVRYAFEEMRNPCLQDYTPWEREEMKLLVQLLLQNGARDSINQPGNSALSHVIRHINDWGFCYDLLDAMLQDGGNPNIKGRDGSFPLMVCLTPLINNDPFKNFTEATKARYMNCLKILCMYGANPNCVTLSKLTPLHILVFTASENVSLMKEENKAVNFAFIRNLLVMFFQFGLDPNVGISDRTPNIFLGVVEMLKNSRSPLDMEEVYELILTLIQYGVNPNMEIQSFDLMSSYYGHANPFATRTSCYVLGFCFIILSKKDQILNDPNRTFSRVLYLFYMSMNHRELFNCLKALFVQQMSVPADSPCQNLCEVIREMVSQPRSLKQITRVVIHKMLRGKPGLFAEFLPIPRDLQDYIKNFDP